MNNTTETTATESIESRLARLNISGLSDGRSNTVKIAHDAGVDDATLKSIAEAVRVKWGEKMVLPVNRLELCSRGRGWARLGKGDKAQWGERVDGGYEVGPGRWTVGGNDGFTRKKEDVYDVKHVTVGGKTWTIAN
jgi:hypothetical protein